MDPLPNVHRLGDVLDLLLAQVLKPEIEQAAHHLMNHIRDADAARPSQTFQPRCDIDAIAVDVVAIDDHIAEVDADPELDAVLGLEVRVVYGDALLNLDRAPHRIDHARKLDQDTITRKLDDAAAMLCDLGFDEVLVQGPKMGVRAGFVRAHQPTVADHVGGEDRGELAFELLRSHGTPY